MPKFMFAGYPAPYIYAEPGSRKIQQLIWGDYVLLLGPADGAGWLQVKSRGEIGWMKPDDLQDERLLEISFVDIGQGDGTFIVTPDDRFMLVDAGQTDNMKRFLSWRFDLRRHPDRKIRFPIAVVSHPDQDHYKGFSSLIKSDQFQFDTVFHNGIVERAGADALGPRAKVNGTNCITDVIRSSNALKARLADALFTGDKAYPNMLAEGVRNGRIGALVGLSAKDRYLPGFDLGQELSIQVLGPWPETDAAGSLRWFGDVGKTKNGHSVVLKLCYRDVRVLLGGDLNVPAERHLLRQHLGLEEPAADDRDAEQHYFDAARAIFEVDVAKACHHGSADFTSVFLRAVNPLATVVSSGDDEPHAHPRPDALGSIGKHSRGDRPLIFSTELARSGTENIRDPHVFKDTIQALIARRDSLDDPKKRATLDKQIASQLDGLERSVAVYGMINLRTDGHRVLLAQKLERPRGTGAEWDFHCLERGDDGTLRYVSKHDV